MTIRYMVALLLAVFLAAMGILGRRGRKYASSFRSSITAGKSTSLLPLIGVAMGSHIGSGFVVGSTEYGATYGIGGVWYGVACGASLIATGLFLSRFAYRNQYLSLSDYFAQRYGGYSVRLICIVTTLMSCVAVFAGQLLAGKAIFYVAGLDGTMGILVTACIAWFYSVFAGMWGVVSAASIQSAVIFVSIIGALATLFFQYGIELPLTALPERFWSWMPFDSEQLIFITMPTLLATTIGQPAFQHAASARSEKTAVWGEVIGGLILIPVSFVPILLGVYGRALYPEAPATEIFARIAGGNVPMLLGALLLSAVICAVLSTCNSLLIAISTNIIHDIVQGLLFPDISDRQCRKLNVAVTAAVCVTGVAIALAMSNIIELLSLGCSFCIVGCLVPLLGGVWWKKGTAKGATASAVVGIVILLLDYTGIMPIPYECLLPLIPAAIVYVAVSLMTQPVRTEAQNGDD